MTPETWQRVKVVVADATDLDGDERAQFVSRACADDTALRREVESVLAHAGERFERAADAMSKVAGAAEGNGLAGIRIGAYELVREIGRGGMGAVYLARRADQEYNKEVAIKLLKRGTDTDEVLRRFRAEREILARLEHPNIAQLLDGGTTQDGLPYFVMEYVAGARITDFCFASNLSIHQRIQLFLKVCAALQFAHQNLVVHRDIKPANILVTADGEPKLLDFGIAKLLDPSDEPVDITVAERQRLTPAYASPEQVRGQPITTVSDVYALGALLYELLAGVGPHRFSNVHPAPAELLRVIAHGEPARPSVAAADPQRRHRLRGDLDRILLKALRKEPAERYRGVGSFAEDLRRYLEGLPVRARPATFGYRAGKFLGRNKSGVAIAAVLVIGGIAGTVMMLMSARQAELQAKRAERHFKDVRQLANSFLFEFHDAIATLPGATAARQLVVSRALEYLDKLAREASGERALQLELAAAYLKIGDVQGKPYTPNLGDSAGAVRSYQKAAEIVAPLARTESSAARNTDARRLLSTAYISLAAVQARTNELDAALANNERALRIGEQLLTDGGAHADEWRRLLISCHTGMGDAIQAGNHQLRDLNRYRAAVEHYRRALPIAEQLIAANPHSVPDLVGLAKACARIAGMLPPLDVAGADPVHFREAMALHDRNLELLRAAMKHEPGNSQVRRNIAGALIAKAYARCVAATDLEQAAADCDRAIQIFDRLAAADSLNAEAQQDLSYGHYVKGWAHQLRGEQPRAAEHYHASLAILEPLIQRHPGNIETSYDLEQARRRLAETDAAGAPR
ncbi:MAG: Serine/threonine protein kinase [uncultured Chthoniobacterales bacterium]|uniref:Serine/threonine protein kinase n=1 Tax=uncultured Chthoniobacterales bacterium TaxID=1836801 RepID=A0A6J4HHD2_9BACT|nr:MAG: Serine/threonine protein kinase [uncultured Chthoniobacterales bacterium]